jgi:hypothetical protein
LCDANARHEIAALEVTRMTHEIQKLKLLFWKLKSNNDAKINVLQQSFVKAEGEVEGLFELLQHMRVIMTENECHFVDVPALRGLTELLVEFTTTDDASRSECDDESSCQEPEQFSPTQPSSSHHQTQHQQQQEQDEDSFVEEDATMTFSMPLTASE